MTPPERTRSAARRMRRSCGSTGCNFKYSAKTWSPWKLRAARDNIRGPFAAYTLDSRTLAHRPHAGSHRLGAARGVLRDLSCARHLRGHRGAHGGDARAARPRLVAATARPAAACAVCGAGADSGRGDAAAAQTPLPPVGADPAVLGC